MQTCGYCAHARFPFPVHIRDTHIRVFAYAHAHAQVRVCQYTRLQMRAFMRMRPALTAVPWNGMRWLHSPARVCQSTCTASPGEGRPGNGLRPVSASVRARTAGERHRRGHAARGRDAHRDALRGQSRPGPRVMRGRRETLRGTSPTGTCEAGVDCVCACGCGRTGGGRAVR